MKNRKRQKILFITPRAEREGSGIYLLRFLKWLKTNTDLEFEVLYGYGGGIENEFRELTKAHRFQQAGESANLVAKAWNKILVRSGIPEFLLRSRFKRKEIALIVSNTVVNHELLPIFADYDVPVISVCHEMESAIRFYGKENFRKTQKLTSHFIAVSGAICDELVDLHGIPRSDITTIHGFLPIGSDDQNPFQTRKSARKELGLPDGSFVVGASGTLSWRKAPDVFIQIAGAFLKKRKDVPIYFVWVGGSREGDYALFTARHQVEKMGLAERVIFLEHTANPARYFSAIDVFAMVSREDPFPLVCLEAAAMGKPVICFDLAGGMPEFVGDKNGFVVPYLDIDVFSAKILELFEDPGLRAKMGRNAAKAIRQNHDIEIGGPKILGKITEYLTKQS